MGKMKCSRQRQGASDCGWRSCAYTSSSTPNRRLLPNARSQLTYFYSSMAGYKDVYSSLDELLCFPQAQLLSSLLQTK